MKVKIRFTSARATVLLGRILGVRSSAASVVVTLISPPQPLMVKFALSVIVKENWSLGSVVEGFSQLSIWNSRSSLASILVVRPKSSSTLMTSGVEDSRIQVIPTSVVVPAQVIRAEGVATWLGNVIYKRSPFCKGDGETILKSKFVVAPLTKLSGVISIKVISLKVNIVTVTPVLIESISKSSSLSVLIVKESVSAIEGGLLTLLIEKLIVLPEASGPVENPLLMVKVLLVASHTRDVLTPARAVQEFAVVEGLGNTICEGRMIWIFPSWTIS